MIIWANELSARFVVPFLDELEQLWGRDGLRRFVARWGVTVEELHNETSWVSMAFMDVFLNAVRQETGSDAVIERCAAASLERRNLGILYPVLLMLGSPGMMYAQLPTLGERFNRVSEVRLLDSHRGYAVLSYGCRAGYQEPSSIMCLTRRAQLPFIPTIWGLPAAKLVERECQHKGAAACVYELHWPEPFRRKKALAGLLLGLGLGFTAAHLAPALGVRALWGTAGAAIGLLAGIAIELALSLRANRRFNQDQNRSLELLLVASDNRFQQLQQEVEQRKAAEAERRSLEARLRISERMASVGLLAAGVAHEINNPLTYVLSNLDFLASTLPPNATADWKAAVKDAKHGAERVRRIVGDLKLFSRNDEVKLQAVDVAQVIESVVSLVANDLKHRAQLVKSFEPTGLVLADASHLGQVFLNLLVNAVQALPDGRRDENRIEVVVRDGESSVVAEVRDTGPGIPEELLGRIFEPFFTTKTEGQGTGLGLAICHNIVEDYGGKLQVRSTVGQGTTFTVTLPKAQPSASPITLAPDGLVRRRPARILIVDDEPLVVTALCRGLPTDRIEGVHSVREAEALWERTFPFDVVLCDVMMPNSNGADLYEKLRRKHPGAERRIIFMTGQAFSPNAREMLTTVPNRCLNKPIDAQELALAVRAVMQEAADASPPGRAH